MTVPASGTLGLTGSIRPTFGGGSLNALLGVKWMIDTGVTFGFFPTSSMSMSLTYSKDIWVNPGTGK